MTGKGKRKLWKFKEKKEDKRRRWREAWKEGKRQQMKGGKQVMKETQDGGCGKKNVNKTDKFI